MERPKENTLAKLKEQFEFLRNSVRAFYDGHFAESVRIALAIRILVHETPKCKPLLKQVRADSLNLRIKEQVGDAKAPDEEEIFSFAVSVRMGPVLAPAVDLNSSHYKLCSVDSWWNRPVFSFRSQLGRQLIYTRKKVVLILADREGGAHVDPKQDPDYIKLLTDQPFSFGFHGVPVRTPDLARFLTGQSGVEMLEYLKRNFFPNEELPSKWEYGPTPPLAMYFDHISGRLATRLLYAPPSAEINITRRGN